MAKPGGAARQRPATAPPPPDTVSSLLAAQLEELRTLRRCGTGCYQLHAPPHHNRSCCCPLAACSSAAAIEQHLRVLVQLVAGIAGACSSCAAAVAQYIGELSAAQAGRRLQLVLASGKLAVVVLALLLSACTLPASFVRSSGCVAGRRRRHSALQRLASRLPPQLLQLWPARSGSSAARAVWRGVWRAPWCLLSAAGEPACCVRPAPRASCHCATARLLRPACMHRLACARPRPACRLGRAGVATAQQPAAAAAAAGAASRRSEWRPAPVAAAGSSRASPARRQQQERRHLQPAAAGGGAPGGDV